LCFLFGSVFCMIGVYKFQNLDGMVFQPRS
jgi:hypothetical protein